ncbi:MAG TPA: hypothetical protein ENK83_08200, partial [Aliiroseovarius sp.]|nr:hypothetical protein [Aliiroseovarius sp.]
MVSLHANNVASHDHPGSPVAYFTPDNLHDALTALEGGARAVAGGTDLYPALAGAAPREDLVDLSRIAELEGVTQQGAGWRIGATTSWNTIAHAALPRAFTCLQQAAREVGAIQIQQAGTIGGNLVNASPAADGVPPLLLLDAEVELRGLGGARRLKLAQFLRGPGQTALERGELITAVYLPAPPDARSAFVKLGSRAYLVISFVMAAALVELEGGARAVAGGTDLYPALAGAAPREDLVDLSRIAELEGVTQQGAGWRVGATTSWNTIAHAALPRAFTCLQQAAREVGAIQIQQAGTIGGNLVNASPAADGVPPLLLLDAEVELRGLGGARRLKLAQFLRGPGQ